MLGALARDFDLQVDVVTRGKRKRAVRLLAPLADNVGYVLRAADDHLRGLIHEGDGQERRAELPRARATS